MWSDYENGLRVYDSNAIFSDEFQKFVNQRKGTISPVTFRDWQNSAKEFKSILRMLRFVILIHN